MLSAAYTKHQGHWCAGSPSKLHHEAQQRHKGVSSSACEQLCSRLACPCYQYRTSARECRVSPPGDFERSKKSGQGFDAFVRAMGGKTKAAAITKQAVAQSLPPNATASSSASSSASSGAGLVQAMAEFVERERQAWRLLPGCAAPPDDPYSDAHLAQLLRGMPQRSRLRQWAEVLHAWRGVCMTGHVVLVSLYKGRHAHAAR